MLLSWFATGIKAQTRGLLQRQIARKNVEMSAFLIPLELATPSIQWTLISLYSSPLQLMFEDGMIASISTANAATMASKTCYTLHTLMSN